MDIGTIIAKYIELRDRKAEMGKRHSDELAPLNTAMEQIENWLMHQMNESGVDQLKVAGTGTAFKANSTSCQIQDATAFKEFVFTPAVEAILNQLDAMGIDTQSIGQENIVNTIRDLTRWDMVDFRAGKKGITEYIANENMPVPGVNVNTVATISIRRA